MLASNNVIEITRAWFSGRRVLQPEEVATILDRAWADNADTKKLGFAVGFARKRFNETLGAYVRCYYAKMGHLPSGHHDVLGTGRHLIYLAPLKLGF